MLESYLVLYPDGSMKWIHIERSSMLKAFHDAIGCNWLENVYLPLGFCCVVDEIGKVKQDPQPLNPYASKLYPGSLYGDPLVGPVIFCRIDLVDGESDWCPLLDSQLSVLSLFLGLEIPPKEAPDHG